LAVSIIAEYEFDSVAHVMNVAELWSVPAKYLRSLLDDLARNYMDWKKSPWDGYSQSLSEYFRENRIDPKIHPAYRHFYVQQAHSVASTYTWKGTNLYQFADKADEQTN
jgi:hypothetical protein